MDISNYEVMSLAYDVAFDLTRELETELLSGEFEETLFPVLSGCYSTVDYYSNRLAALGMDDEDLEERANPSLEDYMKAASIIQQHIDYLRDDLYDERCPNQIDYKKIHAIVGLRAVAEFILHAANG